VCQRCNVFRFVLDGDHNRYPDRHAMVPFDPIVK
jgi:hypothetical protein